VSAYEACVRLHSHLSQNAGRVFGDDLESARGGGGITGRDDVELSPATPWVLQRRDAPPEAFIIHRSITYKRTHSVNVIICVNVFNLESSIHPYRAASN